VNILYPGLENKPVDPKVPDVVVFNQPTTDSLAPQALLRGIKAEVSNLFGDYGSGAIADSISGLFKYLPNSGQDAKKISSQIPVIGYFDIHSSSLEGALQNRMGSFVIHERCTGQEREELRIPGRSSQWYNPKGRRRSYQPG